MKKMLFSVLCFFFAFAVYAGEELFKNPKLENNASSWSNWGRKSVTLKSTPEGLLVTGTDPKLNNGIAQSLKLKPGVKYVYSCRVKGKLPEGSYVQLLNVFYNETKKNGGNPRVIRNQEIEWDTHTRTFTVPKNYEGTVVLRPYIILGPGELTVEWVSLKEADGEAAPAKEAGSSTAAPAAPQQPAAPATTSKVVHPKMKLSLMECDPVNIAAHVNEKRTELPAGASVKRMNDAFVVNYAFTTPGHDAVMFDLKQYIPSCAKISMDVTADGKGHQLYMVLIDASGEAHLVESPIVLDFNTKSITKSLSVKRGTPYDIFDSKWGGDKNQRLDLPLQGITFVIDDAPDTAQGTGTITLKNVTIGNW